MNGDDIQINGTNFNFSSNSTVSLPPGFVPTSGDEDVSMVFAEFKEQSRSLFPFREENSPLSVASSVVGFSIAGQSTVNLTKNITIELDLPSVSCNLGQICVC